MVRTLVATYEQGVLKLDEPLDLQDKTRVELRLEIPDPPVEASPSWQAAKEFIGFIEEGPEDEPIARDHDRSLYDE